MISSILDSSKTQPIIIVQSDHGPASLFGNYKNGGNWNYNWSNPTIEMLDERSEILNVFHLPDIDKNFVQLCKPSKTHSV